LLKTLFKLAVFFLILHALWQVVPPYWRYREFEKAVNHLALTAGERDVGQLVDEVLVLAAEHKVPVEREGIQARRERNRTYIDVVYVESASPIPGWRMTRPLEIHAEAFRF
jgi:hypothetical protein